MKKIKHIVIFTVMLIFCITIFCSCQKKSDPPVFTFLPASIQIDSLHTGVQFYVTCTNIDINMSKAIITDPIDSQSFTYLFNGTLFLKNQKFGLQDANYGYPKKTGQWKIKISGNRKTDGVGFDKTTLVDVN